MAKERFSARQHRRLFRPRATLQHNRSRPLRDVRRMWTYGNLLQPQRHGLKCASSCACCQVTTYAHCANSKFNCTKTLDTEVDVSAQTSESSSSSSLRVKSTPDTGNTVPFLSLGHIPVPRHGHQEHSAAEQIESSRSTRLIPWIISPTSERKQVMGASRHVTKRFSKMASPSPLARGLLHPDAVRVRELGLA